MKNYGEWFGEYFCLQLIVPNYTTSNVGQHKPSPSHVQTHLSLTFRYKG